MCNKNTSTILIHFVYHPSFLEYDGLTHHHNLDFSHFTFTVLAELLRMINESITAKGAHGTLTSTLHHFDAERVSFTIHVGSLQISQRCQLPQQAMLSIRLQVGTARRSTRSFPYRRGLPARDMNIRVNEEIHLPCIAHRDSVAGTYNSVHCRVILSTRYEMYGKHGYKTLAWESFPLHELLPDLLSQSAVKAEKTISFEILQGVSVDISVSVKVEEHAMPVEEMMACNELTSPMSLLTEGSDLNSPAATAQSRQLRTYSIDINGYTHEEAGCMDDLDLEPVFVVTEPSPDHGHCNIPTFHESAAATSTEEEDSPLEPQYYQTADYSTFLQDEIDLNITDHNVDLVHVSPTAAHRHSACWLSSIGTQTDPSPTLSQDEEEAERLLEEHTENDMLLQGLILSKMEFATLSNEVDALRKYNYTLEQRLLQFYRRSDEVL